MDNKYLNFINRHKLSKSKTELLLLSMDDDSFAEYSGCDCKIIAFENVDRFYPVDDKYLFLVDNYAVYSLHELNEIFRPEYDDNIGY